MVYSRSSGRMVTTMAMQTWRPFGESLPRWEPLRHLAEIQSEMNRLFDEFFERPALAGPAVRMWAPFVNMRETKDDLVLTVEVPGVREKDLSVSITGDLLSVKGERRFEDEVSEGSCLHLERAHGKFERTVQLPMPVQSDKVKATYRDGVLEIKLPKADEVKPREIRIDPL
jgi:HSP20 family protein